MTERGKRRLWIVFMFVAALLVLLELNGWGGHSSVQACRPQLTGPTTTGGLDHLPECPPDVTVFPGR